LKINIRIILLIIIILITLINSGCMGKVNKDSFSNHKNVTVEVILKTSDNDFWKSVRLGADAAGKEFGIDISFNSPLNENDIEDQISMVNNAIAKKVDGIVLAAADFKKLVPVAEKAIDAGIPVIVFDSALDSSRISTFIATDNKSAAIKAGNKLVEVAGRECNIAIISFVKGAASSDQREEGIYEVIKKYPGINVVAKEYSLSDEGTAEQLAKDIVKRFPEIDAIVALNGPSTSGAAKAIEEMNLTGKIKIIGFDNTNGEIDYLEDNAIQAIVIQNPYNMGYLGVKNAVNVINKVNIPKTIDTGSTIIDKNNMYLPENQKLLFPFVK
jgi:ribose transport system substrate-binding protein